MSRSIRVSEKHGVNPSVTHCFFCQKAVGVALFGRLPGDAEAPHAVALDHEPCDECKLVMSKGVILISVDETKSAGDLTNPYRTGGWCAVSEDFIRRVLENATELRDTVLAKRIAFIPDDAWDMLGLPRGKMEGIPSSVEELKSAP